MTCCKQTILNYKNVSANYETRTAVLKALRAGRKPLETGRFLKVHRSLVYRFKKVLDQNQDAERLMSLLPERNTKFSASVMVLGVISSKGDVMPPHFFDTGAEGPRQAVHRGP
jgi:hypothetical protein